MTKVGLLIRYLSALLRFALVKPVSDVAGAKDFMSLVLDHAFQRGVGRELETVSIHAVFPDLRRCSWTMLGTRWATETPYIVGVAKAIAAKTVLEIGTYHGEMTLQLAANLPDDGVVITVDIDPADVVDMELKLSESDRLLAAKTNRDRIGHLFHGSP